MLLMKPPFSLKFLLFDIFHRIARITRKIGARSGEIIITNQVAPKQFGYFAEFTGKYWRGGPENAQNAVFRT